MGKNQDLGSGINIPDPQHWKKGRKELDPDPEADSLVRGTDRHQNFTDPQHWLQLWYRAGTYGSSSS
jgi:hypothetical protein